MAGQLPTATNTNTSLTATPTTTNTGVYGVNPSMFTPTLGHVTGSESTLASWAAPYVTNMLGKAQALSNEPYQVYKGPLTAGASDLQKQAFAGIAALPSYSPTSFGAGVSFDAGSPTKFTNGFVAPDAYKAGEFTTGKFDNAAAQQYMNPYLQQALNPMLEEARRQAGISRLNDASRLTRAGAYGGSRQAIMESELNRNLMTKQNDMLTQGYNTAFDKAANIFGTDQQRALEAQRLGEQSRQFGATQGMTAADLNARYGLEADKATEQSRQFGKQQSLTAQLENARLGLEAQKAADQSRQFGARYGLEGLNTMFNMGNMQRAIEQQGIAADLAEFERQRNYPMQQLQFQNAMLQGMPISAQNNAYQQDSALTNFLRTTGGLANLYESIFGPAPKTTTTTTTPAPTVTPEPTP